MGGRSEETGENHADCTGWREKPPLIGAALPRLDTAEKVRGETRYASDYYCAGMLWAGAKRSGIPHGIIRRIDISRARRLTGIIAVLTHKDIAGTNRQGVVKKDQPVIADFKVRHCGDAVALVVAESREVLADALERIIIDFEPLPAVTDPEQALLPGSPLVHEDNQRGNVLYEAHIEKGRGHGGHDECDVLVEGCFTTSRQEHACLETEAGWAILEDDGKLVITCSTQTPFRDRAEVAEALGIEPEYVRIVAPYPGGAFGRKDGGTIQSLLGLAALHSGRKPVKMWLSREESIISGSKRHPARMQCRLGARRDGAFHYLSMKMIMDTGPYDNLGSVVLSLALEHAGGPYRIPHTVIEGHCVYTNNPISGAFRGFGAPQAASAIEQLVDMAAARLGIDPLEIRRKNCLTQGDTSAVGSEVTCSVGIAECLEAIARDEFWARRESWKKANGPFRRRGVGLAAVIHGISYGPVVPDESNAKIELTEAGKFRIYCGVVDMGQGNASTNAQIAGAILKQPLGDFELVLPDTDKTLPSGSASASRCTYSFGNALILACDLLRKQILVQASLLLQAQDTDDLDLLPGFVRHRSSGNEISLRALAGSLDSSKRISTGHFRAPVSSSFGEIPPEKRMYGMPHLVYSFGAHMAAIEVDEQTGEVEIVKYCAAQDCGKILNPLIFEQQVQGAIATGIGMALFEDFKVRDGYVLTGNLASYCVPLAQDIPDIEIYDLDFYEPTGPFGLKGAGEIAADGPVPAIANALADACAVRFFNAPFTPERIVESLTGR